MLKHSLLKLVALITKHQIYKWANNPETTQKKELKKLIKRGPKRFSVETIKSARLNHTKTIRLKFQ